MQLRIVAGVLGAAVAMSTATGAVDEPAKPMIPLRLQVLFTRLQGDKKVASAPYAFPLVANDARRPAKLRMGINVPLRYEGKDNPSNVVYKNVGNAIDCHAESMDAERFRVSCSLEQSSVYAEGSAGPSATGQRVSGPSDTVSDPPLLRTFSSEATVILKDGQTAQHSMATDPVSGEVLKVDITLTVVK